ncbi:MAG TPA: hypothetical protein VFZ61_33835 [Polyangiales bacterium]
MAQSRIAQSRRALVATAADILEDIDRARKLHEQAVVPDASPAGAADAATTGDPTDPGGDLLVDFVRLQVDYLLRLGELGRAHRDHAFRTLELLYRSVSPARRAGVGGTLLFTADVKQQEFVVENRESEDASLSIEAILHHPRHQVETHFTRASSGSSPLTGSSPSSVKFTLPRNQPTKLRMSVSNIESLPAGRIYHGEVKLSFKQRARSVAFSIDRREGRDTIPKVDL